MPSGLEGHQQHQAGREDARVADASRDAGRREKEQHARIGHVPNRQGTDRHHDGEVGDRQQHVARRNRAADSGQLDTDKEVGDGRQPGAITGRQRDAGSANHGGGHAEDGDPEHQGEHEVAPDQPRERGLPGLQLSRQGERGPAEGLAHVGRWPLPFRGNPFHHRRRPLLGLEACEVELAQGSPVHQHPVCRPNAAVAAKSQPQPVAGEPRNLTNGVTTLRP